MSDKTSDLIEKTNGVILGAMQRTDVPLFSASDSSGSSSGLAPGVLTVCVQQVSDNSPAVDYNSSRFTEKFKGPYGTLKDLPTTTFSPGKARTVPAGAVTFWNPPPLASGWQWIVQSASVNQVEAGEHAILTIVYGAEKTVTITGYTDDDNSETWNLSWGAYSVNPYAFCANDMIKDTPAKDYSTDWTTTSWRKNIEDFFGSRKGDKSEWQYVPNNTDVILRLNEAECLVAQKVMSNTNATYHYPIVTHTTVKFKKSPNETAWTGESYPDTIGDDIDHIKSLPSGCPYDFPTTGDDKWEFIKVADDITCEKTKHQIRWIRRTSYWGARKWDENFYGNTSFTHSSSLTTCRWKIGEL